MLSMAKLQIYQDLSVKQGHLPLDFSSGKPSVASSLVFEPHSLKNNGKALALTEKKGERLSQETVIFLWEHMFFGRYQMFWKMGQMVMARRQLVFRICHMVLGRCQILSEWCEMCLGRCQIVPPSPLALYNN